MILSYHTFISQSWWFCLLSAPLWFCCLHILYCYLFLASGLCTVSLDTIFRPLFCPFSTQLLNTFLIIHFLSYVYHTHEQITRTQTNWYYTGLPTLEISCQTTTQSTWLLKTQNNPIPLQSPDPVLELPWLPSPAPIVQSSRLPGHRAQVGVCPLHEDLSWSQGSSSVPQQDLPDRLPPFDKPCPWILWGMCQTLLEQGSSWHQPPGSQRHHPMESW